VAITQGIFDGYLRNWTVYQRRFLGYADRRFSCDVFRVTGSLTYHFQSAEERTSFGEV
jgi:hypothetical protein